MDIRFADHPSFHRAAAGMTGGALLAGAALHPLTALAPVAGGLVGIAVGASLAYGRAAWRLALVAGALAILLVAPTTWPASGRASRCCPTVCWSTPPRWPG